MSVLETAGELQFPAMHRLSISSAHGFLIIYEVTQPNSLELLKHTITEIQQVENTKKNQKNEILIHQKIISVCNQFEVEIEKDGKSG